VPRRADGPREPEGEISGTGADLRDHLSAPESESAHDRGRSLPSVALPVELALDHAGEIDRVTVAPVLSVASRHRGE
jgi:hypothetical protein